MLFPSPVGDVGFKCKEKQVYIYNLLRGFPSPVGDVGFKYSESRA